MTPPAGKGKGKGRKGKEPATDAGASVPTAPGRISSPPKSSSTTSRLGSLGTGPSPRLSTVSDRPTTTRPDPTLPLGTGAASSAGSSRDPSRTLGGVQRAKFKPNLNVGARRKKPTPVSTTLQAKAAAAVKKEGGRNRPSKQELRQQQMSAGATTFSGAGTGKARAPGPLGGGRTRGAGGGGGGGAGGSGRGAGSRNVKEEVPEMGTADVMDLTEAAEGAYDADNRLRPVTIPFQEAEVATAEDLTGLALKGGGYGGEDDDAAPTDGMDVDEARANEEENGGTEAFDRDYGMAPVMVPVDFFQQASDSKGFMLLQLPSRLPINVPVQEGAAPSGEDGAPVLATAAGDMPSGALGVLKVHASGAVKLHCDDIVMDVKPGIPCSFGETAFILDDEAEQYHILGDVSHRMVFSADVDSLLASLKS